MSGDELTFEDRVLVAAVRLAGDAPLPLGQFIEETDVAAAVAALLGVDEAFVRSEQFFNSQQRLQLLAGMEELEQQGLVKSRGTMGSNPVAPTSSGRARVRELREREQRRAQARLSEARTRIVDELKNEREYATLDLRHLGRAGITMDIYEAALEALLDEGLIERSRKPGPLLKSEWRLTDAGRGQFEAASPRGGDAGWREAAKLKRQLELLQQEPSRLIRDPELRRRCVDLLSAEGDHDRAVREACVVLETRVRAGIDAADDVIGTALMDHAFSAKSSLLRLSTSDAEQLGAMQMYRGLMAFYRNPTGHRLHDNFDRDDALRIVAWIDHLLLLVARASSRA
jgi:uncharacterized protein (TIGR02391 family)